jgi:sulfatase modifying factor 1
MRREDAWILDAAVSGGSVAALRAVAAERTAAGALEGAAAALDQAFMLAPEAAGLAAERAAVLSALAREIRGMSMRYIPDGSFLMGSDDGEPDERPVHARRAGGVWMCAEPVSWASYCSLMGWSPAPGGEPPSLSSQDRDMMFLLNEENTLRSYYCSSEDNTYDDKPMVAVSSLSAEALGEALSGGGWRLRLPTEAEWEKAARGGLVGCRYSWGDAPPDPSVCCCDVFSDFTIAPTKSLAPNGYGLRAMCGSVWEWTADGYDAEAYARGAVAPEAEARVLRGGSWADCPAAATVSFRMSRATSSGWGGWGDALTPTIGFRLCMERVVR